MWMFLPEKLTLTSSTSSASSAFFPPVDIHWLLHRWPLCCYNLLILSLCLITPSRWGSPLSQSPPLPLGLCLHGEVSPDNQALGPGRAAVRRDEIRETDRITWEEALNSQRQILQQWALFVFFALPITQSSGVAFRDYCCPSTVCVFVNDPSYPGFLFLPLSLSLSLCMWD